MKLEPKVEDLESLARKYDKDDVLSKYRSDFEFPQIQNQDAIYFVGNSLGLMPKSARACLEHEIETWSKHGVDGHFRKDQPWTRYHERFLPSLTHLLGAKDNEVTIANSLTVNLHLLLIDFYQPTSSRSKIGLEAGAFPSDHYALQSQCELKGFPNQLVELSPQEGSPTITHEDIDAYFETHGESLALLLLGALNFKTGQFFDIPYIVDKAHQYGVMVGIDCAHATGNVPLKLHEWNVDFAVFCTYKYLNGGPGSAGGMFVHERHLEKSSRCYLKGWWGVDPDRRFEMSPTFYPAAGVDRYQLSNGSVFSMAPLNASLEMFREATMEALRAKSIQLTGFLEQCIQSIESEFAHETLFTIVTPQDPRQRGAQISLRIHRNAETVRAALQQGGVMTDFRPPDFIRVAPTPLYNTFDECFRFAKILRDALRP